MRALKHFGLFVFLLLVLVSCGKDNDDPKPANETATFRIDFMQAGDYEKFVKIITITGGDFKYRGTTDPVPTVILGDDANEPTWSIEAANVEELNIETLTEFLSVETGPATMAMKFSVYRNGTLLEENTFTYDDAIDTKTEKLVYKAN